MIYTITNDNGSKLFISLDNNNDLEIHYYNDNDEFEEFFNIEEDEIKEFIEFLDLTRSEKYTKEKND